MKKIVGREIILERIPDILHDESRFESGVPSCVFYPENIRDLQNILREASSNRQQVTLIGAQTGTTGGAVPEEANWAIAFSAMNRILEVTRDNNQFPILLCEPGVTLEEVNRFLQSPGQWPYKVQGSELLKPGEFFYPPDPTEMTAQLGGTIATNASGARSFRFGPSRSHVHSLLLVFPSGETAMLARKKTTAETNPAEPEKMGSRVFSPRLGTPQTANRSLTTEQGSILAFPKLPYFSSRIKNASGYFNTHDMELMDLFIGSEGTLAAYAAIGIQLRPSIGMLSGISFFKDSGAAFDFADFLREERQIAAIEFFDGNSLRFIDQYRQRLSGALPEFPGFAKAAVLWEFIEGQPETWESRMDKWEEALGRSGSSLEHTWSGFSEAEKERLRRFRHALPEMVNAVIAENKRICKEIRKIGTDSAITPEHFRAVYSTIIKRIMKSGITSAAFGHLGDYHIHINLIPSNKDELLTALEIYDECMSLAVNHSGTVSAEHGIGKIKKKYLLKMYGQESVEAMRAVKAISDPYGILNPGNLF